MKAALVSSRDYGIYEDWATGKVPGDHEMYRVALENIKKLFDGKYVYPGHRSLI